ncbi:hemerythrin domain-containing protein [Halpernia sp.]|uniref:hemerythrin domain-containing protein n=1 Tax=Halpernia sp. TaxID=2782209 RepID=UPI003A8E9AD2
MNKPLHQFFTKDHQRIDKILNKALENADEINPKYYHQFRTQLLRHIKMEEKILFPAAKLVNLEVMQKLIPRYRLEHGALTALMVPPPDFNLIKVIKYLLQKHDFAEEETGGLYDVCEALTSNQTQEILDQLAETKEVPVHPTNSAPIALESAKRALIRAGYNYDEILQNAS